MAKRRRPHFIDEGKMDMTPLIDCVFLLIMFFILTTEITVDAEDVTLPFALEGKVAEDVDLGTTIILNVVADNRKGQARGEASIISGGEKLDKAALVKKLQNEVNYDMDPRYGRGRAPEVVSGAQLSQVVVRDRADPHVHAQYLRTIITACAEVNPKIYKIEISAEKPAS